MDQFLQATITGLAAAAVLAVAASGLVLTYTTTGIFNFAHGAVGMLGAFAYWQLRFGWGWPAPIALLVVLGVLAPLLGVAIERVVMRGLYDAPETSRAVVSIGLLAALLGVGLWVWPPDVTRPVTLFFGNRSVDVLGVAVTWHELVGMATAVGLAVGLRLLLHRSRAGLAMRAAVDDRALSMLNGARPHRAAMLAWAIGCTTAAVAGILVAPTVGLSHVNLALMIVNAYAAAMIGRLRNLPMTFLGALVLGLLDAYALAYLPTDTVLMAQFRFAIPVLLLFVVLLALPEGRLRGHSTRTSREVIPRPAWPGALATAAAFVAAGVIAAQVVSAPDAVAVQKIVAVAIVGLSLVPLVGFAGQLSLCQMSFAGIGALLMAHHGHGGDPRGLVVAVVVTGLVGALVALPTVRLAGIYLALATAAFAMLLDQWIFGLGDFDVARIPGWVNTMYDNTQRADEFRAEVAAMKLRDPASGLDRLLVRLGVVGLVSGPCFAVAAWFISHGTRNPLQQRDAIVAALLGLTLAVVGGALFVKGAVAGFLRFWMARLCYEQQAQADRIAASLRGGNGRASSTEIVRTR